MATVVFYEKPGCINNTRQKVRLAASGHRVEARDLLRESWTAVRLRCFFGTVPVAEWFNPSAPGIRTGVVRPGQLDADAALQLMLDDPLLIRRPLMQVGDEYRVGFEPLQVHQWIGLEPGDDTPCSEDCPRTDNRQCP